MGLFPALVNPALGDARQTAPRLTLYPHCVQSRADLDRTAVNRNVLKVLKIRRTLFYEGLHAFFLVFSRECTVE